MMRLAAALCIIGSALNIAQADRTVFVGYLYDVWIAEPTPVGSGAEDLAAFTLHVTNTTGDSGYNPSGFTGEYWGYTGITGKLHQHYSSALDETTPTIDNANYATTIDTHFLDSTSDMIIVTAPWEWVNDLGPSAEPSDAVEPFGALADTDFGSQLTGVFAPPAAEPSWDLAYIVAPFGSDVDLFFFVGGTKGGDIIDASFVVAGLGDFDGDGDVDADDVDILCDNIGSADPWYDLDGDGDVDEDDQLYLIEVILGTERGDFNLDGFVNATDLAIMKAGFGLPGIGYADGNANCDDIINATDLAILKASFGFAAPTGGGVPEPMTIGLLSLGGLALLRKRRK